MGAKTTGRPAELAARRAFLGPKLMFFTSVPESLGILVWHGYGLRVLGHDRFLLFLRNAVFPSLEGAKALALFNYMMVQTSHC